MSTAKKAVATKAVVNKTVVKTKSLAPRKAVAAKATGTSDSSDKPKATQKQQSIQLYARFFGTGAAEKMLAVNTKVPIPHRDPDWSPVDKLLSPDKRFYVEVAIRTIPAGGRRKKA